MPPPQEARKEGIFAGLTSGLASGKYHIGCPVNVICTAYKLNFRRISALIGSRLMGFNRNKTLVCGVCKH